MRVWLRKVLRMVCGIEGRRICDRAQFFLFFYFFRVEVDAIKLKSLKIGYHLILLRR